MSLWNRIFHKQADTIPNSDQVKKDSFQCTIQTVQSLLKNAEYSFEKASILEYAIKVIGRELSYSVPARMLYAGETPENSDYTIPLPASIHPIEDDYSLIGKNVVSEPWEIDRLRKAILHVDSDGFRQGYGYYTGEYYQEINLVVIVNGRHHLSAATMKESGSATLQVFSLKEAFPHLKTDGAYWYLDDLPPYKVFDYRVAVLYELARIKHELMLPENVEKLMKKQFENEINQYRSDAYGQLVRRVSCLELEIAIKDYQISQLKGQYGSQKLSEEAQQLQKKYEHLKQNLDQWSETYYDPWEHLAEKQEESCSSPQNNP